MMKLRRSLVPLLTMGFVLTGCEGLQPAPPYESLSYQGATADATLTEENAMAFSDAVMVTRRPEVTTLQAAPGSSRGPADRTADAAATTEERPCFSGGSQTLTLRFEDNDHWQRSIDYHNCSIEEGGVRTIVTGRAETAHEGTHSSVIYKNLVTTRFAVDSSQLLTSIRQDGTSLGDWNPAGCQGLRHHDDVLFTDMATGMQLWLKGLERCYDTDVGGLISATGDIYNSVYGRVRVDSRILAAAPLPSQRRATGDIAWSSRPLRDSSVMIRLMGANASQLLVGQRLGLFDPDREDFYAVELTAAGGSVHAYAGRYGESDITPPEGFPDPDRVPTELTVPAGAPLLVSAAGTIGVGEFIHYEWAWQSTPPGGPEIERVLSDRATLETLVTLPGEYGLRMRYWRGNTSSDHLITIHVTD